MTHSCMLIGLAGLLLVARPLAAQDSLAPGARIRIGARSLGAEWREGILVGVSRDSISVRLDTGAATAFPVAAVERLEVSSGVHAGNGFLIGALGGAAVGFTVGYAFGESPSSTSPCSYGCLQFSRGQIGTAMAVGLGLAGGLTGLVIGANTADWEPAPGWHATPRVTLDRGRPGVGFSLSF